MLSIFSLCLLVIWMDVFFGKVSIHVFCPFVTGLFVLGVEFGKFFTDFGYYPFIRYVICKYLLPFRRLPFSFADCFPLLCSSFLFWWGSNSSFLLLFPLPLETCWVRSCCGQDQRGFCLLSLWGFWWLPVLSLGLSPILSLFLCMV